eukprot:3394359-Karenia_brevis.AAC.1
MVMMMMMMVMMTYIMSAGAVDQEFVDIGGPIIVIIMIFISIVVVIISVISIITCHTTVPSTQSMWVV